MSEPCNHPKGSCPYCPFTPNDAEFDILLYPYRLASELISVEELEGCKNCGFGDCEGCKIRIPICVKCNHPACLGCNLKWCDVIIDLDLNFCCDGKCTYTKNQQRWAYNHLVRMSGS